jgi:hypothetical protein
MATALGNHERVVDAIDWILRIIGVGSLVFVLILYADVRERADCQAGVNEAQSQRAINLDDDVRMEHVAERKADDALTDLVEGLLTQPSQPPAVRRTQFTTLRDALEQQREARVIADKARAENPPVPVPEGRC